MAAQTTGVVPTQKPFAQTSIWVHAFASLQTVPSGLGGLVHAPVAGSQTPRSWQASSTVQRTGDPAVQVPLPSHVSAPLHASPSEQAVPEGTATCVTPPAGSQLSAV